jgi:catecholate siderophore receptor
MPKPPACHRRKPKAAAAAAALLLALAAPGTADAQDSQAGAIQLPGIDVNAAPAAGGPRPPAASRYLAPSTSSATRTETPLRDIPQSVSVTTQQTIRDLSMQSLQDVLRFVPGANFAQGEGNRDTPVLRGQSTTANLFQDGLRDDVQYFRDLYNLDRVEVLLGPNAMIFGRGGAGGVINRVTRAPSWDGSVREVRLQAGSFNNRRATFDLDEAASRSVALRLMGLYEESDSHRDGVNLRRSGINPQVAFRLGERTTIRASYENFRDDRTADRGVPSFRGRPLATGTSTFFGDPLRSPSRAEVNAFNLFAEHRFDNGAVLRNAFRCGDHDKL